MQLAKKICEDWADILYNVNCSVSVEDDRSNKELQEILKNNSWWLLINQACEKAFATGTIALTVHKEADNRISLEMIDVEKIFPLSWQNGRCTECAFVTYTKEQKRTYAIVSIHYKGTDGKYLIENHKYELDSEGGILQDVFETNGEEVALGDTEKLFRTESEKPWFVLISPAIAENIFDNDYYDYPLGISVFANAIDGLKTVDDCFDALDTEINLGRKRIFASESLFENIDGQEIFDARDCVYKLPQGIEQKDLFMPENSELRVPQIVEALNTALSTVSNLVGMGKEMYKFDIATMSTAAQVYSTNSELKRKLDKNITRLENELYDIVNGIIDASNRFSGTNINPEGLVIKFDMAQFENEDSKSQRKLREKEAGLISAVEYRMEVFGEDEEMAVKRIQEAEQEQINRIKMQMSLEEMAIEDE